MKGPHHSKRWSGFWHKQCNCHPQPASSDLDWHVQPKAPKVKCPYCLEEISKGATRCKWCTSELDPEAVLPAPNMGKEVPAKTSKKDKVRLTA